MKGVKSLPLAALTQMHGDFAGSSRRRSNLANVAKARGMATVAEASGLGRESLYKALAPGAKVRYETVRKLVDSLGVKLTVTT
jgi:probable addiction module antidote protein